MRARIHWGHLVFGLLGVNPGIAGAQEPPNVKTQGLLADAIATALRHIVGQRDGWVVVVGENFPEPDAARAAATSVGLRFALKHEDVVRCSDDRRDCRIVGSERRVITLYDLARPRGDLVLNVILRVITSPQVESPDGTARLFPTLREITLSLVNGVVWTVTGDQVIFRS